MGVDDHYFMRLALAQAQCAFDANEVPVGAVLVNQEEQVIARAHNQPIALNDPTAHAEVLALREAGQRLSNYRLVDTTLYVTLEPCAMCAVALVHARVKRVVFGAYDKRAGACCSVFSLLDHQSLNHRLEYSGEVMEVECRQLLQRFFKLRRKSSTT